MSQAVTLNLNLAVTDVGVVGAEEPEEDLELTDKINARIEAKVQAQVQRFQQQAELQQAQLAQTRQALSTAMTQVKNVQAQAIEEMRHQAVDLAMAIARKVIAQEIQAQRVEIDPIILGALRQLPTRGEIIIHLNPEDVKRSQFAEETQSAHARDLKFIADPEIAPGGCLVESVEGSVETSIESSLKKVGEALRQPEGE